MKYYKAILLLISADSVNKKGQCLNNIDLIGRQIKKLAVEV